MSKDKPTLTLDFGQNNINADELRERMQQRIKQLQIKLPTKESSKNTDNVKSTEYSEKEASKQVNKQLSKSVMRKSKVKPLNINSAIDIKAETKIKSAEVTEEFSNPEKVKDKDLIISEEPKQTAQIISQEDHIKVVNNSEVVDSNKTLTENLVDNNHAADRKTTKMIMEPEKVEKLLQYLRITYPKCFTIPIAPLALKIHQQLWENELNKEGGLLRTKSIIRSILYIYVRGRKYRQSLVLETPRLNLDGTQSSNVTNEELPVAYRKE